MTTFFPAVLKLGPESLDKCDQSAYFVDNHPKLGEFEVDNLTVSWWAVQEMFFRYQESINLILSRVMSTMLWHPYFNLCLRFSIRCVQMNNAGGWLNIHIGQDFRQCAFFSRIRIYLKNVCSSGALQQRACQTHHSHHYTEPTAQHLPSWATSQQIGWLYRFYRLPEISHVVSTDQVPNA